MKKVLTLLLVFGFTFSVSAATHVPEIKAEKFMTEKSILRVDLVSVDLSNVIFTPEAVAFGVLSAYQDIICYRFKTENISTKIKKHSMQRQSKESFYSKLPDKLI